MEPVAGEPEAEGFNLDAVDGTNVSLDDFQGKFVLLNFWATWCAPCRREMPALNNLHNELNNSGLEVVGVHVGPSLNGVKNFLEQVPVEFTILVDQDMGLTNWGVLGLPTTFLIDSEGRLIHKAIGERKWDSPAMVRFLTELMSGHPRMVQGEPSAPFSKGYFLESLKKFIGLIYTKEDTTNRFFPN